MKTLVYRIGADQTKAGGGCHGRWYPGDRFVYLPIPEPDETTHSLTYDRHPLSEMLSDSMGPRKMHLDPDFRRLSYGNPYVRSDGARNPKGTMMLDWRRQTPVRLVFLAALKDPGGRLRYGFIGQITARTIARVDSLPSTVRARTVHGRRRHGRGDGISAIALADPGDPLSGRYSRFLEVAERRDQGYRIRRDLLQRWKGWSARDGYCQQGGPWKPGDHARFGAWLNETIRKRGIRLLHSNWDGEPAIPGGSPLP